MTTLYHPLIIKYNANPCFYEKRPEAQHVIEAVNPVCGDQFRLFIDVENDTVQCATFHGYGCAVSKAATAVLMGALQGQKTTEILPLIEHFLSETGLRPHTPVVGRPPLDPDQKAAFSAAAQFPERITCVTLSWEALEKYFRTVR